MLMLFRELLLFTMFSLTFLRTLNNVKRMAYVRFAPAREWHAVKRVAL